MKVSIKDLEITMELGNKGVTFDVYDNQDQFLGDLRLSRGTVEWCKGKTRAGNGVQVKWPELINFFEGKIATTTKPAKKITPKKK
jgi:hypothetical protein